MQPAARPVDLANKALALVAADPIHSLEDDSPVAETLRELIPMVTAELLGRHPWRFARVREQLTLLADPGDAAVYGFKQRFALPTRVIGPIRGLFDQKGEVVRRWSEGAEHVYADTSPCWAEGCADVSVSRWPGYFMNLAGHVLAARIAPTPLIQNGELAAYLTSLAYGSRDESGIGGLLQVAREADGSGEPTRTLRVTGTLAAAKRLWK